ncbi:hypothetical protein QCA50_003168 [Cerrena zonata]|uniref:Phytocyanin domain-containing protein n=1 Tax=Cerrena zonata TaxID=2478898 RepID=A0AAW0GP32_9APHY
MVFIAPFIGAVALFAGYASALPRPDSAVGQEVAVSAPNGIVLSDTVELASQSAAEAASAMPAYATTTSADYSAATTAASYGSQPAAYMPAATEATSTSAAYASSQTYGSGSSSWSNSMSGGSYDSCVQQCVASFGAPAATYTPSPTQGSSGSGSTHTVIVAPTQGVLRYIPFAVNASVGDTVRFVWHANNHTVTKSSQLELCNKTSDKPFASGTHDKDFTFDQLVNDTNPTFYYCGTPGHCQKGMFGIINPPNAAGASTSVGMMMSSIMQNNTDLSAMSSYTNSVAASVPGANTWGTNMDMAQMPSWSYKYMAENVLYARTFMAMNPDVITQDGNINMDTTAPLMFPTDLSTVNNAAAGSPSSPAVSASASSASATASTTAAAKTNGARSTAVSGGLLAIVALAASFLAL